VKDLLGRCILGQFKMPGMGSHSGSPAVIIDCGTG